MYQILCDGITIFDPREEELIVSEPKCKLEVNTTGEASFSIFANHPNYYDLMKMKSIFEILQDGQPIFRGRMTMDSRDFNNIKYVDLEGVMAFFNDSMIHPFKFPEDFESKSAYKTAAASGNVVEYFMNWLITQHNSQVEDFQKLKMGRCTVSDPNNYITRSLENDILSTWEVLKTRLFDSGLGGYFCIRYEADGNYIDYLEDFEETNTQKIVFGENLLDILNESDALETYSAVIPLGSQKDGSNDRITIASLADSDDGDIVKKGDTLYSKSAVEKYGWIYAPTSLTTWDDVTQASNLKTKGVEWLEGTAVMLKNTITSKAVDLHFADAEIESFRIYQFIDVESLPHGYTGKEKLSKLEIDLHNPQNTVITIGDTVRSLIDINSKTKKTSGGDVQAVSPSASVTKTETGVEITVTDKKGTTSATVVDGQNGADGEDGYSPTVAVTNITGGHRVSITDVNGTKTFDVMDGEDGQDGVSGGISYAVGDVVVTSTNESPASRFGGTWECFDKHLKMAYYNNSTEGLFTPTANTTSYSIYVTTCEHNVSIRLDLVSATATSETNKIIGDLDFTKIGLSRITHTTYSISATDDTNATMLVEMQYGSGRMTSIDIFPKTDGTTIPAGTTLRALFTGHALTEYMDDAFCDKFFWKKTA